MALSHFSYEEDDDDTKQKLADEKKAIEERLIEQKSFTFEQKKELFNTISNESKKNCLLSLHKKQPLTCGDLTDAWWDKNGKSVSTETVESIKMESAIFRRPLSYYSWVFEIDRLYLREFDNNFKKTGKVFAIAKEDNNLAILIKGENFVAKFGLLTFSAFKRKKN